MQHMLKKVFSTFLIYDKNLSIVSNDYKWFLTTTNEVIGIHKSELSKKDTAILSAFLTPYHLTIPKPTKQEVIWKERIQTSSDSGTPDKAFRFIYFSYKKNQMEATMFKTIIQEFFSGPVAILWENEHEGIIIEQQDEHLEENISYEQISETLMSDLYVSTKFFIGPYLNQFSGLNKVHSSILQSAQTAFTYTDKSVVTYVDAVPLDLVKNMEPEYREQVSSIILKDFRYDEDFLQTIRTFIQCNLNISVTAKKLYMHRNSLQYRIDKFHEKTGIDLKAFDQAVTVYLALLSNMHRT
ncbi:PucR family transcriptional regulator [Oceanobacillus rekensis]|uniref:PucR family transcriptional regulator n=1 Tax=Oceanobacillus rekensis TaxID=937927 RepID=UPI000B444A1F|nr:helix-turn-helix domain-containing protein [Oceanobacillus rekensis]